MPTLLPVRPYTHRARALQRQREQAIANTIARLTAENTALRRLLAPRASGIRNTHREVLCALQHLDRPSQAAALLTERNGPTLYWTAVHHFGVDNNLASQIIATHNRDWPAALAALDPHTF